jgi:signal transduction histidine kinase
MFAKVAYHPSGWIAVILFWGGLATLSYTWQYERLESDAIEMATLRGRLVFSMVQITRSWNAGHGIYALVTPDSPANPYLEHPDKFAHTENGKPLSLINPAYMTRQINELLGGKTDLVIHLTSLKPINPNNVADEWETQALRSFEAGAKEQLAFQGKDQSAIFRYMAPMYVEPACLKCHAKQGYKLGQVRGGLSVSQPASYISAIIESQNISILAIHWGAFILLTSISIFSLWQNRRQIIHLELARDQRRQAAETLQLKVSELEETRDYLVQNEKHASLGRMVAGFAHEINTPVGIALSAISQNEETIKALNAMLALDEVKEEDILHQLDTLKQADKLAISNLRRAADLVRSFKRTSIDQSSDQIRKFNMKELLDDVLATLHSQFKRTKIVVEVSCSKEIVVLGVPGLLEQLFTNLLMNSLQHGFNQGQHAGTIRIVIEQEPNNRISLRYTDDGVGMSTDVINKIFEPFFTTARGKGGSGLGLYVCYNIVTTQLKGSISVSSTPGLGSCFDINFPAQ